MQSTVIMQLLATLVAFFGAYGGVMASSAPNGWFTWSAFTAGIVAVGAYHGGLWQLSPNNTPSSPPPITASKVPTPPIFQPETKAAESKPVSQAAPSAPTTAEVKA